MLGKNEEFYRKFHAKELREIIFRTSRIHYNDTEQTKQISIFNLHSSKMVPTKISTRASIYLQSRKYVLRIDVLCMEICRNDGNVPSFLAIFVPRESRYHNRRSGFLVPENFSRKFRKVFRRLTRGAQLNSKHSAACFLSETTLVRKSSLH